MRADRNRASGKGRVLRFVSYTLFVAAATHASKHPAARQVAKKTLDRGRAWSTAQLNKALQAPVIKSQGERWRAMRPDL